MKIIGLFLFVFIIILACKKESTISELTPYELKVPSHFPKPLLPEDNPLSAEGVALGKKLFYDKKLSLDNSISCGSCHEQKNAFSDPRRYSEGVNGTIGSRNSMSLVNLAWQPFFFWDGRSKTLEEQILEPVPNPVEMHQSWEEAAKKIYANDIYRAQFYKVFKTELIDKHLISKAIAQFLRTLISGTSKYDVMYKVENSLSLNASEQVIKNQISNEEWAGYDLFKSLNGADCFHCHNGPLMQINKFSNNGLDAFLVDLGRELVTKNPLDKGKFKIPSLRNIALTAPYMHDGRFQTLDEVIEHYSSGIHISTTIDPLIEYANQGGVQLDAEQKMLLKAFLNTLTDFEFVNNMEFAED